ncbi:MAG: STN domain-containing protein, partial [Bacteroidales bacterium]|nr:STN domain-containing protein [Bacteroidales bacterium]
MKKNKPFGELFYRSLKKNLLTMRIAIILMILGILQVNAKEVYSQNTRLSLNFTDAELVKVLDKIEDESEFFFLFNEKLLDAERKVNITANDELVSSILDNLFTGTDVKYTIIDRKIILAPEFL